MTVARRFFMLLVLSFAALGADAPLTFPDPVQEARYHDLLRELRCLVCQNQSLEDSHADLAQDLRIEVHEMMLAGRSNQEILDFMVDRYGDFVLYRPPVRENTWLLWYGPFLLLFVAIIAALVHSRSRARLTTTPLSSAEASRVRELLGQSQAGDPPR